MTLTRRSPKQGFINVFSKKYAIVNVGDLGGIAPGTVIDETFLQAQGFVKDARDGVKILGGGELRTSLTFKLALYSESAKKKIEAAGGKIESLKPAASEVKV
jgi:large subunit ribosomal protein L15